MLNDFITSFKLKMAYRTNSIIYMLRNIPLIKKIIPNTLYKNSNAKELVTVISIIWEVISTFLFKILYILLFVSLIASCYSDTKLAFINILFFLTIIGGYMNTFIFDPSKDKYYAIVLMRYDAKRYALSNYYYFLIKTFIGFLPFTMLFSILLNMNMIMGLLLPLLIVSIKTIVVNISLYSNNISTNENKFSLKYIIITAILLALAYGLPYFNIGINELMLYIVSIIIIPLGIYSLFKINRYKNFTKNYKELLVSNNIIFTTNSKDITKESYSKQITIGNETSNKEGFEYFNDLFVKRHKKILFKQTKIISFIAVLVIIFAVAFTILSPKTGKEINDFIKNNLPYFLFVMYFINRGQSITQTMFMNCDHSMLTYRFYRTKENILKLFRERLKTLIKLNVIPGIIISIGLVILLYVTGGGNILEYIITFLTVLSMSIFFSIHYLVLYYLLQPYNIDLEMKNPTFKIACGITYFVCYMAIDFKMPTMIFGTFMSIFTIIYSFVALYLAYIYAPKTFKLK